MFHTKSKAFPLEPLWLHVDSEINIFPISVIWGKSDVPLAASCARFSSYQILIPVDTKPPRYNFIMCVVENKKKSLLELKSLYLGIAFLFSWELVSLSFMPSRLMHCRWPGVGGPDFASPVWMPFLGEIHQAWGQPWGPSLVSLPSRWVSLWGCAC